MSMDLDVVSGSLENGTNSSKKVKKRKLAGEHRDSSKKRRTGPQLAEEAVLASSASPVPSSKKTDFKKPFRKLEVPDTDASTASQSEIRSSDAPATADISPEVNGIGKSHMVEDDIKSTADQLPPSDIPAPFSSARISLYLPLYAVSLSSATSSLLSAHLAPLLLTYYPPVKGVVLAFSDPILSAKPALSSNLPLVPPSQIPYITPETLALTADEHGVSWVWLTVTLLVFTPETGMEVEGYVNTCTEGFLGLVSYNYFQTGIARNRIPESWSWTGPGGKPNSSRKKRGKKYPLKDSDIHSDRGTPMSLDSQDPPRPADQDEPLDDGLGFFTDGDSNPVRSRQSLRFRVVDSDVVPVHGKETSLQIEGSLLREEEEARVAEEDALKFDQIQNRRGRSRTPGKRGSRAGSEVLMSGGIGLGREGSGSSLSQTPRKHRLAY